MSRVTKLQKMYRAQRTRLQRRRKKRLWLGRSKIIFGTGTLFIGGMRVGVVTEISYDPKLPTVKVSLP